MTDKTVPRAAWLQLGATILLFGLTWPVMKIGLMAGSPIWLAAGRATLSALTAFVLLALLGRLKWPPRGEWPVIFSVGTLQLSSFFALANLGVQNVPPGRSGVLAYTTMLWMVPLSLLVGERVGWRAIAGAALGVIGIVTLADPGRLDWHDHAIIMGHVYLLLAGFTWALAIMHTRRHRWHTSPLDVLPWQMSVATVLLWLLALVAEPDGHLDFDKWQLWVALLYIGSFAGPAGTWAAVSVTRALPPITTSLGMLGVPLMGILSSILLVGEKVTVPLLLGTGLVIAGIAIVILDRPTPSGAQPK
ncbi:Permease of the drug/metabolite transporter (DMT) superfamily [Enhydrobacter aerosaccus]|uniref:Permease of the drug/metabolite transporter (DMT) superfamily n=1 Tax=Enhydrobacter aerosaccus TaxID=225324 RepID=A0A1T4PMU4_9HYPH|nr:DMT family transporter [Enhydrobacter aerosaccus]SJZ92208.1 Permease of the drug/metabolite transporter (DMT) superfamily [Enhydrobacter aerosaccus]